MTDSIVTAIAHKKAMVCYWPTVMLCLPACNHSDLENVLPGIRKQLGVSVWPAPRQLVGTDVYIDITHWQAPLGGAFAAAWALLDLLKTRLPHHRWRAGIAPGVASARFAAHAAEPGTLIDIPAWRMADVLAYVPLTDYIDAIPAVLRKRLQRDGIRQFDDVLQFSAGDWSQCYGEAAVAIRRACLGLDFLEAVASRHPAPATQQELDYSLVLPANASSHRALRSYLRVMCVRLSRELRQRAQRTGRVELELWTAGTRPVWAYGVGLGMPASEAAKLFAVLQAGLRQSVECGPVSRMRITACQLSHEAGQLDLLDQMLAGQNTQNNTAPRISR